MMVDIVHCPILTSCSKCTKSADSAEIIRIDDLGYQTAEMLSP